jgi:hypothetical protein
VLRIERDPVENALGIINAVDGRQQPRQIYPTDDAT